jgi:uncharacterized membrane protein YphA (DoxX/SURF4 family)
MTPAADSRSFSRYFPAAARLLMGLIFLIMGLNGFLNFLPGPPGSMPAPEMAFLNGLAASVYLNPLVSGVQVIVGVLLLVNRFVPLAVAVIAPVVVNIIGFHLFLSSVGIAIAIPTAVLEVYLAWSYRDAYRPMLAMRVDPLQQ